jgi:NADPH-dependent curcumin reductase CurA
LVSDWSAEDATAAKAELRKMIVDGSLKPWVNEFHGLEKGPEAFVDMLAGGNVGTTTVRLDC